MLMLTYLILTKETSGCIEKFRDKSERKTDYFSSKHSFTMIKFVYARFHFYFSFNLQSIKHFKIPSENVYVTFLVKILKISKCEYIYISWLK